MIKVAEVYYSLFNSTHNMICIENDIDFFNYQKLLDSSLNNTIEKLLKSKTPVNYWDHLVYDSKQGDSIARLAIPIAQLKGENLWNTMSSIVVQKLSYISKLISNGKTVLINSNGGYCYPSKDISIIKIYNVEFFEKQNFKINHNTKYLNLENDAILENHTKEKLASIDQNYSYICSLRSYNDQQLSKFMKEFVSFGGNTLYIYTTGIDTNQVKSYCNLAFQSGIKNICFEYSSNPEEHIKSINNSHIIESGLNLVHI